MDARRCYFPNYLMEDYFGPSPSHWPLSHVRSSTSSQGDSSGLEIFGVNYVGNQRIPIPYQQRTIINLTGRSLRESFAGLKRNRSPCPGSSPLSRELDARETPDPQRLLRNECPSSDEPRPSAGMSRLCDEDIGTDATNDIEEMKQAPTQLGSDITCAPDSDVRYSENHTCTNKASTMAIENIRQKTLQSLHMHQQPNQVLASTRKSGPTVLSQSSEIHAQSTAPPLEQSEDDNDAMNDEESNRPTRVKKSKKLGSHICKLCDITFTRHFDLLRHNQKHQVTEEDIARRTCTNCDSLLSRVDATKRHVDTLPESCNYLLRKQGLRPMPPMPAEHYNACQEHYYKLAHERKKPKGRKKANPAVSLS